MICPYKCSAEVHQTQTVRDEDEHVESTIESWKFVPMKCPKDGCGAWDNGRCRYRDNSG